MLALAQRCAALGWPVHPLAPGQKTPARNCHSCRAPGHTVTGCACPQAGRWCHGFHSATTNPVRIRTWWTNSPHAGVAVSCGAAGLLVLDVDTHEAELPPRDRLLPGIPIQDHIDLTGLTNGFHTLALLAALRGQDDPAHDETTLRVRTPSGGLHIWYRAAPGQIWLCSSGSSPGRALAWQLDVRSTGGYIIAPGTTTRAGTYTPLDATRNPAPLPRWLGDELLRTGHTGGAAPAAASKRPAPSRSRQALATAGHGKDAAAQALESVLAAVADCAQAPQGTGFSDKLNKAAFTAGGLIAAGFLAPTAAEDALRVVADHARPGQDARVASIIRSGLAAGARRPLYPGARS